jgi:hypothetical protein
MNKSAFARELSARLGCRLSRQMLGKYHAAGMPLNSADSAIAWLHMNTVGEPGRRAEEIVKRGAPIAATSQPAGATSQPDDDCGLTPPTYLTAKDGAGFYVPRHDDADIVVLSQVLQARIPELLECSPAMARAVRRAIRETICTWSDGECCPHCRRGAGIVEPSEPDDELEARAA